MLPVIPRTCSHFKSIYCSKKHKEAHPSRNKQSSLWTPISFAFQFPGQSHLYKHTQNSVHMHSLLSYSTDFGCKGAMPLNHPPVARWSVDLCQCGDGETCILACCLPCVTFGQIAEIVEESPGSCISHGMVYGLLWTIQCHWLYSCIYREKMRSKFGLPSDPCNDCCVHFCCDPCALCQEHAELKNLGFNPNKGWIHPPRPTAPPMMPPMPQMYK